VSNIGARNAGVVFLYVLFREDGASTPGTDITHKSVLNITPSVKMEHNIVSNIGARNAGVVFLYENYSDIMKSL
jgi:hypothetical protein